MIGAVDPAKYRSAGPEAFDAEPRWITALIRSVRRAGRIVVGYRLRDIALFNDDVITVHAGEKS